MEKRIIQHIDDDEAQHVIFEGVVIPRLNQSLDGDVCYIPSMPDNWVDDFRSHIQERLFVVLLDFNLGLVDGEEQFSSDIYGRMIDLWPEVSSMGNVASLSSADEEDIKLEFLRARLPCLGTHISKPIVANVDEITQFLRARGF